MAATGRHGILRMFIMKSVQVHSSMILRTPKVGPDFWDQNTVCNFQGKCKRTSDNKNCEDPKPEEAIKILDVIITLTKLTNELQGEFALQC